MTDPTSSQMLNAARVQANSRAKDEKKTMIIYCSHAAQYNKGATTWFVRPANEGAPVAAEIVEVVKP